MEVYETVSNDDGTVSITYKKTVQDINGVDFEVISETHTRSVAEIQVEIDLIQQRIAGYQDNLAFLENEKTLASNV